MAEALFVGAASKSMEFPCISVVIPTHNRHEKLAQLITDLKRQDLPAHAFEIIVVDDGSTPPVTVAADGGASVCRLIRRGGGERSAARNAGAAAARGTLVVFLDDDMRLPEDFLSIYLRAAKQRPDSILVGKSVLPPEWRETPFGRLRQRIEHVDETVPMTPNFCAAGNMAISAALFRKLDGFDRGLESSEDQDLALRHFAQGGGIAYVPEACSLHCDNASDIRTYCRRTMWGSEHLIPFQRRYPDLPASIEREAKNGFVDWKHPLASRAPAKLAKAVLAYGPFTELLFRVTAFLERAAPRSKALERAYDLLLGAHLFRGYRHGLKRFGSAIPPREPVTARSLQEHPVR